MVELVDDDDVGQQSAQRRADALGAVDDVDDGRRVLRVLGKGARERTVPFGEPAARALDAWRSAGRPQWATPRSGPALLLGPDSSPVLAAFLSRLDIFTLWVTVLSGIGIAIVGRTTRGKGFVASVATWALASALVVLQIWLSTQS